MSTQFGAACNLSVLVGIRDFDPLERRALALNRTISTTFCLVAFFIAQLRDGLLLQQDYDV